MRDIYVNTPLNYRVGFNVYNGAASEKSQEGASDHQVEMVIPYREPRPDDDNDPEPEPKPQPKPDPAPEPKPDP